MIDRTQLTEALAVLMDGDDVRELDRHTVEAFPRSVAALAEAARLLLDFPTDEQAEAACKAFNGTHKMSTGTEVVWVQSAWQGDVEDMRAVLVAVRDTMIGDG